MWEQLVVATRFHLSSLEYVILFYTVRIRSNFLNRLFQMTNFSEEKKNQAQ